MTVSVILHCLFLRVLIPSGEAKVGRESLCLWPLDCVPEPQLPGLVSVLFLFPVSLVPSACLAFVLWERGLFLGFLRDGGRCSENSEERPLCEADTLASLGLLVFSRKVVPFFLCAQMVSTSFTRFPLPLIISFKLWSRALLASSSLITEWWCLQELYA